MTIFEMMEKEGEKAGAMLLERFGLELAIEAYTSGLEEEQAKDDPSNPKIWFYLGICTALQSANTPKAILQTLFKGDTK